MNAVYLYAIASVFLVSLVSLVGIVTLSMKEETLRKYIYLLVSLAVGALLGGAFIHLIPESFETIGNNTFVSLEIVGGILLFLVVEKFLHIHHHTGDACESVNDGKHIHPVGYMILVADGVHNFVDGVVIGASYLISIEVGIAATLAILLHEIPQEISDFGVLLHAGYSKKRALLVNFLSALTAVAGTILVLIAGDISEQLTLWFPPIAAGSFIYIAMSDLIPEMHKNKSVKESILQIVMVLVGVVIMFGMLFLE